MQVIHWIINTGQVKYRIGVVYGDKDEAFAENVRGWSTSYLLNLLFKMPLFHLSVCMARKYFIPVCLLHESAKYLKNSIKRKMKHKFKAKYINKSEGELKNKKICSALINLRNTRGYRNFHASCNKRNHQLVSMLSSNNFLLLSTKSRWRNGISHSCIFSRFSCYNLKTNRLLKIIFLSSKKDQLNQSCLMR